MDRSRLVYNASPYAGDVEENIRYAVKACRYAVKQGVTPVAAHLQYPRILRDPVSEEREAGINMGLRLLKACGEIWVCGGRITQGMGMELAAAERPGIPVRWTGMPEETPELFQETVQC